MTAKIEWYREVLELEPNSKVFFPLARLLAEDGQAGEAIELLEKGLDRHPEFMEARLYLIELLHTRGMKEQCNAEVARLGKMFASYAGFWQAWAACLASEQGQEDTASIIRFLAAHFVSGPINLYEVLNRGLASIMEERQGQSVMPQPEAVAAFAAHTDEMLEDLDSELEAADPGAKNAAVAEAEPVPVMGAIDPDADMLPAGEAAAPEMAELAIGDVDPVEDMPQAGEAASPDAAELSIGDVDPVEDMPPVGEAASPEAAELAIGDVDLAEDMPPVGAAAAPEAASGAGRAEADTPAGIELPERESAAGAGEEFAEEESFSLRTRSMAEVLAEQGDIQGALDIYQELAAAAANADEAEDIKRRMATLAGRLTLVSTSPAFKAPDAEAAARGKEKLIGMLEALAERVEARVES